MIEAGTALDHKTLDTTLGPQGQKCSRQVDATAGVRRRPHNRGEGAQTLHNPLGGRIGEQDQDFLTTPHDKVFLQRHIARIGNDDRKRLRHTIREPSRPRESFSARSVPAPTITASTLERRVRMVRRSVAASYSGGLPFHGVLPSTELTVLMITYGLAPSRCPVGGSSRSS